MRDAREDEAAALRDPPAAVDGLLVEIGRLEDLKLLLLGARLGGEDAHFLLRVHRQRGAAVARGRQGEESFTDVLSDERLVARLGHPRLWDLVDDDSGGTYC
uniref:Uncharacterized protein n=1 Tax=Neobodo designis TaxID=312471 RepID=A0A7S1PMG9_NEODS